MVLFQDPSQVGDVQPGVVFQVFEGFVPQQFLDMIEELREGT
jgi:hypothetical protein